MYFEPSRDLPQAHVVREPSSFTEMVVEGIAQWFRDRLRWARPRMIPLVVALVGLGVTVEAVNQLSRPPEHVETAEQMRKRTALEAAAASQYQPGRIRIVLQQ